MIDLVSHSERCIIKEVNGFLKAKCEEISSVLTIFKCAFSEEYYYRLAPLTNIQLDPMINSTCSNDPYGYQASINVVVQLGREPCFRSSFRASSTPKGCALSVY